MTDVIQPNAESVKLEFAFPEFISYRSEGLFVRIDRLGSASELSGFVDTLHRQGARFSGLDYPLLLKLLYDDEAFYAMRQAGKELRLAAKIVNFPAQRKALYRPVKIQQGGKLAEYMFEPVSIEVSRQVPVYGSPDAAGVTPITGYVTKVEEHPARLDFDEFVADMWLKGVKFGLDESAILDAIISGKYGRITVARQLDATAGRDAEIQEISPDLHRDNSPRIMADGKADLGQFKNRFPQIAKGANLLRKVPRMLGKQGRKVGGEVIEPKLPRDLDLRKMVAAGTQIEQRPEGECIVSTMNGFLTLDPKSNRISVTEKLENKAGISVKTTGDLMLTVDEFIEHGEVQEGREVHGRNMMFKSDVFGRVLSDGGNIQLKKNLSGGTAETLSGNIDLAGRVSRAVVRSADGEVTAKFCESSTIIGRIVRVEHAVSCEIVADVIEAGTVEGCMLAAKRIHILRADERRGKENMLTMLIPDMAEYTLNISKIKDEIAATRNSIVESTRQLEALNSDAEFVKYFALANRIKKGEIKLSQEQLGAWRKLADKHAKAYAQAVGLPATLDALNTALAHAEEALESCLRERDAACEGVSCKIDVVAGQTSGQSMRVETGAPAMAMMQPSQIREILQRVDAGKQRIFSGDSGSLQWKLPSQ